MAQRINLEGVYREAGRSLRRDLFSIDFSRFNEAEAQKIRRDTRLVVSALNIAAAKWVGSTLLEAGKLTERKSRTALEILGKKPRRPQITDPGYNAREKALATLLRANGSIRATVEKYVSTSLLAAHQLRSARVQEFNYLDAATELDAIALEALMKEKSRGWLAKQIADFLRALLEADEFIEINGRTYKMSKYAKMVARTELRNVQTDATLDLCRQYENDLVQWSDHSTECEICEGYEGNIYSISGTHPNYPPLDESPPAHPNCKHSLLPTSEEAIQARSQHL